MDTQVWIEFLKQNWLVIAIALIILFIVLNVLRTVIKWVLAVLIIGGLLVYSGISLDKIGEVVSTVKEETVDTIKAEAMNMMMKEAKEAKYTSNGDGTYSIKAPNLELKGSAGSEKVEVTFRGVSVGKWDINDTIRSFINDAKSNTATK
ncbi:hypothetical protein PVOR_29589 [Paenibacillus vortex V453]|uniref:Uncharacterized protein n=2 Tax=Paenibacillus TaxID=44249 RepID=A0A163H6G3_9BACL|nr:MULTISPECIES: hypothetical protein [Paenibacillus]ANA79400.1 hypothetical protein A3958_05035 [Paenibacillus glucanolyticus]AVV56654.1 hypothetical protein C7121_11280 [Paenibacillus glucanolyticus]AWP25819.1 hypothetical protein B9D94_03950 [Paenibacillus sp. Cedars]EFU38548.1 hypothetical protein PVOR_29589 [Paenibacillus vortex V453]ETT29804.1 hypothetical protein C169_29242 [Paenibacillus sp. FSL R5-808]